MIPFKLTRYQYVVKDGISKESVVLFICDLYSSFCYTVTHYCPALTLALTNLLR